MKSKSKKMTDKLEYKQIKALLVKENQYIDELFKMLAMPPSAVKDEYEDNILSENSYDQKKVAHNGKSRAKSFEELQARFAELRGKKAQGYSDKLLKKNLKTRLKNKGKQLEKNNKKKLVRTQTLTVSTKNNEDTKEKKIKPAKPVFNSDGKMVFSKFDFSNLGQKKDKKMEKNPKKILQNINKEKEHIKELVGSGDKEKAQLIKEKHAWQNALAKAEGKKIKDDTELLQKSVKKQEQLKKKSKKKWEARKEGVQKAGEERQKKRTDNIEKRKKEKKNKSLKKAVKKGKVIPGF